MEGRAKSGSKSKYFAAAVMLTVDSLIVLEVETGRQFVVARENVDDSVLKLEQDKQYDDLLVAASADVSRVYSVAPRNGTFFGVFDSFFSKPNELPAPFMDNGGERTRRDGGKYFEQPSLKFRVVYRIVGETPYAGMTVSQKLRYMFAEDGRGNTLVDAHPNTLDKFSTWFDTIGTPMDSIVLKYSDNVLPELETILQANAKVVMLTMKNGWLTSVNYPPAGVSTPKINSTMPTPPKVEQEWDDVTDEDIKVTETVRVIKPTNPIRITPPSVPTLNRFSH